MNRMFDLLLKKLQDTLYNLNMGTSVSKSDIDEMWTLLHHLHYVSYDLNSDELLYRLLEYYG